MSTRHAAPPTTARFAPVPPFAGFWRRLAAFALDFVALGFLGWGLGVAFHEAFAQAGAGGRAIGFVIAGLWFAPLESGRLGGASPGKRVLGLRVVRPDGSGLPAGVAALRYALFGVPYFLNGMPLPSSFLFGPGVFAISLLVFGLGAASVWLFLTDRRGGRRTLHDRLTGAAVVRGPMGTEWTPAPLRRWHRVAVGAFAVLAAGAPFLTRQAALDGSMAPLRAMFDAVQALPDVRYAGVSDQHQALYGANGERRSMHLLRVLAVVDRANAADDGMALRVAAAALSAVPDAMHADVLQVTLQHGYDIGISTAFTGGSMALAPAQWKDRIAAGAGR